VRTSIAMADTEETFDEDLDLSSPGVLDKYKWAREVVNVVMTNLIQITQPLQRVVDICAQGDRLIESTVQQVAKKVKDKGIAFPVCISVNNCAGHFSPLPDEPNQVVLKEQDAVKIDFGVHIDGFIVQAAHTVILGQKPEAGPLKGKLADAICAAHFAAECALRLVRPGGTNIEVTKAIRQVADIFHVNPLEGVLSHQVKKGIMDGNKVIINRQEVDQIAEEFQFEQNEVYVVDIVMSTGEGKAKEVDSKTTVFKRALDRTYSLKLQASRQIFSEIQKKSPVMAFTLRSLDEKKRRIGITEIVKHDLLDSYPVLYEKEGEHIVQFKFNLLVLPGSTERLTSFALPHVTSDFSVDSNSQVKEILARSPIRKKKKTKKAKKAAAPGAAGQAPAADGGDDDGDDEE